MLEISIDYDGITLNNNERGFEPENVVSICQVGKSTKANQRGYIGLLIWLRLAKYPFR